MFERIWNLIALAIRALQLTAEESELRAQKRILQQGRPFTPEKTQNYELAPVRLYELSGR